MNDDTYHAQAGEIGELRVTAGETHHVEVGERHDGLELLALFAVDDALDDEVD